VGDVEHDRHVAQRPREAARADRVAHRLVDAGALGDLQVERHRLEPAGGDGHHHELGAVEAARQVGCRLDAEVGAGGRHRLAAVLLDLVQGGRVDVVQHDRAAQVAAQRQVAQQLGHPVVAATSDEADAGVCHAQACSLV
jgi:hypothetical protein